MNLSELRDAFLAEVTAHPDVNTYVMDDTFNINARHATNYPAVWMPIPSSTMLFNVPQKGRESFAVPFTIYDLQGSLTINQQIDRITELELIAKQIFRDMPRTYQDIIDYTIDAQIIRGNRLHNDRLLGVSVQLTLTIWTGWDCA